MVYVLFWMKPGMPAFDLFVYICMVYICIAIGGRITQIGIPQTALILLHCCVPSLASIWISISTCRTIFVLNYLRWEVILRFANIGGIIGLYIFHDAYDHVHSTICCRIQYWWLHKQFIIYYNGDDYIHRLFCRRIHALLSTDLVSTNTYMLSGCELIDTENISLPSQNMKLGGEWAKRTSHKLHILSSRLIFFSINHIHIQMTCLSSLNQT